MIFIFDRPLVWNQKRPCEIENMYRKLSPGKLLALLRWDIQQKRKVMKIPYFLDFIHSVLMPINAGNWRIMNRFSQNFCIEDYYWGARLYLKSLMDAVMLWGVSVVNALSFWGQWHRLFPHRLWLFSFSDLLLFTQLMTFIHVAFREVHRRFDWAQLWMKVSQNDEEQVELIDE